MSCLRASAALLVLALAAALPAQEYELLADLNQIGDFDADSDPRDFFTWNGTTYFTARLDATGRELYASTGTASSTWLVLDLRPGPEDSNPQRFVPFGGRLWFTADDGVHGRELWATDGTAQGTQLVLDLEPGAGSPPIYDLCATAGKLWIRLGSSVWVSDGTPAGTFDLQDRLLPPRFAARGAKLVPVPGGIGFFADDGTVGTEPWFSDGTRKGTQLLADLTPGPGGQAPDSSDLVSFANGFAWLASAQAGHHTEIHYFDVPARTHRQLGTSAIAQEVVQFGSLRAVQSRLWLVESRRLSSDSRRIWIADANPASARLLRSAKEGQPQSLFDVFPFGGHTWFFAQDPQGEVQIWRSDGSPEGTNIAVTRPASTPKAIYLGYARVATSRFYFSVVYPEQLHELWVSDGTTAGTTVCTVQGLPVRQAHDAPTDDADTLGDALVFSRSDPRGAEPWISDTATPAVSQLANLGGISGAGSGDPRHVNPHAGRLYFGANDWVHGYELWSTDGTKGGTKLVADLRPGMESSMPRDLFSALGQLFFFADDGVHGNELWVSDGTSAGTRLLKDLVPGAEPSFARSFVEFDGRLYFRAGSVPDRIWVTDGTTAGTRPIEELVQGAAFSGFDAIWQRSGDSLYFRPGRQVPGEFYVMRAGSLQLQRISPVLSVAEMFGDANGALVFRGMDGQQEGVFVTRGTAATTYPILTGAVLDVFVHRGALWIARTNAAKDRYEFLRSDGTPQGLVSFATLPATPHVGGYFQFGFGPHVVFGIYNWTAQSAGIWAMDGTAAGTVALMPGQPSSFGSSSPESFWFAHGDAKKKTLLWYSDGTAAGTYEVATRHQVPEVVDSVIQCHAVGGRQVFIGKSPVHGIELFVQKSGPGRNSVGRACGADSPWLDTGLPRIAQTLQIQGGAAPRGSAGALLLGAEAASPWPLPGVDCRLYVDPLQPLWLLPFAVTQSHWQLGVVVPNDARFVDLRLAAQTIYLSPSLELQATAGIQMLVGR